MSRPTLEMSASNFTEGLRNISTDSHDEAILDADGVSTSTPKNKKNSDSRLSHSINYTLPPTQSSSSFLENYGTTTFDLDSNLAVKITGKHENFHTIDWVRELSRSRQRHKQIYRKVSLKRERSFNSGNDHANFSTNGQFEDNSIDSGCAKYWPFNKLSITKKRKISGLFDAASGWICVLFIGIATGFCAGIVNISSEAMSDFKSGLCTQGGIYLNHEACCWSADHEAENCTNFRSWGNVIFRVQPGGTFDHIVTFIFYNLWGLVFALTAAVMVKKFAPYACGSGIPEVKTILSGFVIHGYMGKWTLLIKNLALPLAVGAGMCLGKEGPMVHIASCCGNFFAKKFKKYRNEAKRREILSAACAAGVSVAFGAPIGGVLFSLEEASYYFPLKTLWRSFLCAMIAAITFVTFNPYGSGNLVMFPVDRSIPWSIFEVIPFAMLGIAGGIYGAFFNKMNMIWCNRRKHTRLGKYPILEVCALALITTGLSYPDKYARMSMVGLIRTLFSSCTSPHTHNLEICAYNYSAMTDNTVPDGGSAPMTDEMIRSMWSLFYVGIIKMFLTIITFGCKVPCGLFIPTLCVGSIFGRVFGMTVVGGVGKTKS